METHQLHIRPADFFTINPAIDVPGSKNESSVLVEGDMKGCCSSGDVQQAPTTHLQGDGHAVVPDKSKL